MAQRRRLLLGLVSLVVLLAASAAAEDRVDTLARILQLEDSATYDSFLDKVLFDKERPMADRVRAARAIGHIGDPDGAIPLLRALADSSMDAAPVCQAIGELWAHTPAKAYEIESAPVFLIPLLLVAERNPSPQVRAAAFTAIALAWPGEGLDQAQNALNDIAANRTTDPQNELLLSLIRVAAGVKPDQNGENGTPIAHAKRRESIFLYGFTHRDNAVVYQAAYLASRKPMLGLDLAAPLKLLLSHASLLVRAQAMRALALRKQADPEALAAAQRLLADGATQEKIAAIEAVAALASPAQAVEILKKALAAADQKRTTSVHQAIFEAFGKLKADGLADFLWDVSKQDVPYRRFAGIAAAKAGAQARVLELVPTDFANNDDDAAYFIDLLAAAELRHKLNWLAKGDGVPERFVRNLTLRQKVVLALAYDEQGEPRAQAIKDHPEWWRERDGVIRTAAFASAGATGDPAVIKELIAAIKTASKERNPEPTIAVLEAMNALLESDTARGEAELVLGEMARQAVGAADLRVRRQAVALLYKLTREIHKKAVFKTDTGKSFADYQYLARQLVDGQATVKMTLQTTKGDIRLVVRRDLAPLAADNFLRLAGAGFYQNLVFHRVVPGFVIQGGDPLGLGVGGPGYTLRSEEGAMLFGAGALGLADAGHDSAGSQFFFTVAPKPHLDGQYTAFGEVADQSSLAVIEAVTQGDKILGLNATGQ